MPSYTPLNNAQAQNNVDWKNNAIYPLSNPYSANRYKIFFHGSTASMAETVYLTNEHINAINVVRGANSIVDFATQMDETKVKAGSEILVINPTESFSVTNVGYANDSLATCTNLIPSRYLVKFMYVPTYPPSGGFFMTTSCTGLNYPII